MANLTDFFFDNGQKVTPLPDVGDQLFLRTREEGNDKLIRFGVLLVLSTAIATGGILVDPSALPQAYAKGQGTVRLQARFHTEPLPGGVQAIVVTELPYGVSPDQIVAEVVKAARAEKIRDVTEMPRNLTDRHGTRVQIRCKRGGSLDRLISDLFRTTSLRVTVGINMTVLVEGTPRQIG